MMKYVCTSCPCYCAGVDWAESRAAASAGGLPNPPRRAQSRTRGQHRLLGAGGSEDSQAGTEGIHGTTERWRILKIGLKNTQALRTRSCVLGILIETHKQRADCLVSDDTTRNAIDGVGGRTFSYIRICLFILKVFALTCDDRLAISSSFHDDILGCSI